MVKVSGQMERQAFKRAEKVVEKAVGRNPTFAKLAMLHQAQIPVIGVVKSRQNVIKAINVSIQEVLRKGIGQEEAKKELFDMLQTALLTPEYVKLLEMVDLGEEHAKILINEAIDKKWTPMPVPAKAETAEKVSWWRRFIDRIWRK